MTTRNASLVPIDQIAGVRPVTDGTIASTKHWTFADKIRFNVLGYPEKIGGWEISAFQEGASISGVARSIYSAIINGTVVTVIGSNQKVYSQRASVLTNITPLQTASVAVPNSLATEYGTLANNPFTTSNGTGTITVADTNASLHRIGDIVFFSGATGTIGGIPSASINGSQIIRSIGVNSYTIRVATNATSTASGGGASVVRATGKIRVTSAAHGQANGNRVKIEDALTTGGVLDTEINGEFIIRNVTTNTFDIFTAGIATSAVSGGGGADTIYHIEIAAGAADENVGQGYGMGLYGAGLYGTAKQSAQARNYPRIWFFDRYADSIIMNAGNQTPVYYWDGDTTAAPILVPNAPAAVNYAFVSDNILVTFGAGGVDNKIFASDQGDITEWTSSSTNQVFEDNVEGVGRLTSSVPVDGQNLIFTENATLTFRYIGLPLIWEIKLKEPTIGIIAPMARVAVKGVAYWMGRENFYMWRGAQVEVIPANSQTESTILRYVFDNLNVAQKSKIFAWHNKEFNEIWWHYPSAESNEPDRIARVNLQTFAWTMDTINRTAAEYPDALLGSPRLIGSGILYKHEVGNDDAGNALPFRLESSLRNGGRDNTSVVGLIPDRTQTGDINVDISTQAFPQSAQVINTKTYAVAPTTERVPTMVNGRYWKYSLYGAVVGQRFMMGNWQEYLQAGGTN